MCVVFLSSGYTIGTVYSGRIHIGQTMRSCAFHQRATKAQASISYLYDFAMVTKIATKKAENRKLTILEQK